MVDTFEPCRTIFVDHTFGPAACTVHADQALGTIGVFHARAASVASTYQAFGAVAVLGAVTGYFTASAILALLSRRTVPGIPALLAPIVHAVLPFIAVFICLARRIQRITSDECEGAHGCYQADCNG
jgi:precorrin-2 methylase